MKYGRRLNRENSQLVYDGKRLYESVELGIVDNKNVVVKKVSNEKIKRHR